MIQYQSTCIPFRGHIKGTASAIYATALQKNVNLRPWRPLEQYIAQVQNIDQILSNLVKFAYSTVVTVGQQFGQ